MKKPKVIMPGHAKKMTPEQALAVLREAGIVPPPMTQIAFAVSKALASLAR
jgi:hypothetical protein